MVHTLNFSFTKLQLVANNTGGSCIICRHVVFVNGQSEDRAVTKVRLLSKSAVRSSLMRLGVTCKV